MKSLKSNNVRFAYIYKKKNIYWNTNKKKNKIFNLF